MIVSQRLNRMHLVFGILFFSFILILSQNSFGQSTISGIIYDKQRNPLDSMDVELLNDYYQSIQRSKTDASGRYQFDGLVNGRYSVRVYAFRYDLVDQTQEIEINTQTIRGAEGVGFFLLDFYLVPRKGGIAEAEAGLVFAQEVPDGAKKLYDDALQDFSKKRSDEAIKKLDEAIKVFPDYFLALNRIGKELFMKEKYAEAVPFLLKASEVNPKSAGAFYYLGAALNKLSKQNNNAAIISLTQANNLAPASVQILYLLGKVEREEGKLENAEKHLLLAKKNSDKGIAEIHKELAQLYANDLKKYKEAADELELYLKASKMSKEEEKTIKNIISNLREKAKVKSSGS